MTNHNRYLATKRRVVGFILREGFTIIGVIAIEAIWITAFCLGVIGK